MPFVMRHRMTALRPSYSHRKQPFEPQASNPTLLANPSSDAQKPCDTALRGAVPVSVRSGRRVRREPADGNGRISGAMSGLSQRGGAGLLSADALAGASCARGRDRQHGEDPRRAGSGVGSTATPGPHAEASGRTEPSSAAPAEALIMRISPASVFPERQPGWAGKDLPAAGRSAEHTRRRECGGVYTPGC